MRAGEWHALPDPRRAAPEELQREIALVRDSPVVAALLEAVDTVLLVLNSRRQVVAGNAPRRDLVWLAGLRPGEMLACTNARPAGCGTSPACETCGALGAILGCGRKERAVAGACVIPTDGGASLEFDVRATPIELAGERFTVLSMRDVSAEKRREALEQVFFHDVLNTVSGMRAWTHRLARPDADVSRMAERLDGLSRQLEREIRDHQAFVLAEGGQLVPQRSAVPVRDLLEEVKDLFAFHALARDRTIETSLSAPDLQLETDRALLARVLVNMLRNALEATEPGGAVRLACEVAPGACVLLSAHNEGLVPPEVQPRIFERSFSTKGPGRGLGTYGMKLIGERVLGGQVSFSSAAGRGTTFSILLPPRIAARNEVATPRRR
jgi:signal transduction histidine kinase